MSDFRRALVDTGSIQFAYPADWKAAIEQSEDATTVTLDSPGVSFAIVAIYPSLHDPDDLMDEVVETLRESHSNIELEEHEADEGRDERIAEVVFFSLDFITYCWLQASRVGDQSVMVMVQGIDQERPGIHEVFEMMRGTLASTGARGDDSENGP